uniref:Uncharacterized protein n=1 Tax=Arundo donax TaxID=35708 RepID=A0A0A9E9J3_ARUDO
MLLDWFVKCKLKGLNLRASFLIAFELLVSKLKDWSSSSI